MAAGQRILFVEGSPSGSGADAAKLLAQEENLLVAADLTQISALLRNQDFAYLVARIAEKGDKANLLERLEAARVLDQLPIGIAGLDQNLQILWANAAFRKWCEIPTTPVGGNFFEVLGLATEKRALNLGANSDQPVRLEAATKRRLEWQFQPFPVEGTETVIYLAIGRDVTAEYQQQKKLEALHQAGNELAALSAAQLADMSVEERVESLKLNIRRLTHEFLHYDVIEIRLRDPKTGKLEPLLQEGMAVGAASRSLYACATGNGITGNVAATGKGYLCPDTAADPLYVLGAEGARSSMTAPLVFQDEIIGTLNVESPRLNAFGEDDLRFLEMFGREIAAALHTLELLSVEKWTSASRSVEAINREVVMPVDEILGETTAILDRYIGHDPDMAGKLKRILAAARSIKESIQKVGEDAASRAAVEARADSAPSLKSLRLLVVDNDERVRRSAHTILGRFGCIVETARDGQEALTMARLSAYDAILADIRLPDIGGYEIYCRLKQTQPQSKVILMSAYGYDPSHALVKARQDGLRHVLFKPFRVDQLLDALSSDADPSAKGGKCRT